MKFPCTHHFAPPRLEIFFFNPPCPVEKKAAQRIPAILVFPCVPLTSWLIYALWTWTMKSWAKNVTRLMEGPNWPFRCSDMLDNKLSQLPTLSQCFHLTSYKCGIKSSHVTVSVLVHLCHDDIAGLCFLSMWNNKDIKSRSNPRLCTHTLPPPFLSPIKKKPNSQKKLNMAVYLEISCRFFIFGSLRLPNNVTTHNSILAL